VELFNLNSFLLTGRPYSIKLASGGYYTLYFFVMYDKNAELTFSLERTYFIYVFFTILHVSLVTDIS
jgi:hypothetical protein